MITKINRPLSLALMLSMTGCEFIGPQIYTRLPLPEVKTVQDDNAVLATGEIKPEDNKKTTKVEIFAGLESNAPSRAFVSNSDKSNGRGEFNLNFDDADLGEVTKVILSDILGKNYTISPQVTGKVTLQTTKPLAKDELLPTLELLLSVNNAALINQNGTYVIKPITDAVYSSSLRNLPGAYQLRIIPIRNVAASEIAEILKPLMPEKALLEVDPKRNIILVAGTNTDLSRILDLINVFDVDQLKGRSFALFTPAHADASTIIEELEQIFNNASSSSGSGHANGKKDKEKDKEAGGLSAAAGAASGTGYYRFIEIDRLNAILAITYKPESLRDIETWVLRLDKTSGEGKGGVNVYRAQHHSAMELSNNLNIIFGNRQQNTSQASVASGLKPMSASNGSYGGLGGSYGGGMGGSSGSSIGGSSSMGGGLGGGMSGGGFGSSSSSMGSSGSSFGNSGLNTLGSGMGMGAGQQQALMPNVKIIADESNNALIIVGNAQEYATIIKVLKQLDVLPLQVLIDATIVEVQLKNDLAYGIEWFLKHGVSGQLMGGGNGSAGNTSIPGSLNLTNLASGVLTSGFSYAVTNNASDVGAVLQAQAVKNNINVLSSPSLMVLNNQEATILVGDSVPVQTGTVTSATSGTPVVGSSNTYIDTGVNLAIKPRVNANGLVLMDIIQSVNQATTTTTSTITSPTITKRQIQTNVAVQSGETIVLGGLIQETNTYNRNGIPLLHELPYIGSLFGGTTRNKDKTELVVLLTPRVMKSRQDALDVTDEFKRKLTGIYDGTIKQDTNNEQ